MKRSLLALTTTLLTATLALSSVARADKQSDWQEILNRYQARLTYMCQGAPFDINQIFASYAPNWTSTDSDGTVRNLDNVRSGLQNFHVHGASFTKCAQTNYSTGTDGQIFGVRYNNEEVARFTSANQNMDVVNVSVTITSQVEDIWKRTPDGWRLVSTRILNSNTSQGQPQAIDSNRNYMYKLMLLNQGYVW